MSLETRIWSTVFCFTLVANATILSTEVALTYDDYPFVQDYSEKVPLSAELSNAKLLEVHANRDGRICVLSDRGLLQVHAGKLRPSQFHRPLVDMQIRDMEVHKGQFVYLTDKLALSNAWAGRFLVKHQMPDARQIAMGRDLGFLVVGEQQVAYLSDGKCVNHMEAGGAEIKEVLFDGKRDRFLFLTNSALFCLDLDLKTRLVFEHENLNCLALSNDGATLLIGTSDGYLQLDVDSFVQRSGIIAKLPSSDIRCIEEVGDKTWFGTPTGAFALRHKGRIEYYVSKRWLVDDTVVDIAPGPNDSVLILSRAGLNIIHFKKMTLADKAKYFDDLTRKRHIRYGFNSALVMTEPGNLATGALVDQDNDGLWTAMYLAGELFRYAVTKSDRALRNCCESFEAMERLTEITPMEGFPARSFERVGYDVADRPRWHTCPDGQWVWKGTTSSDEIVGHFFAYTVFAEIIPEKTWRQRAVRLMDSIMDHIVRNDWYLIDYDGKPTQWGRWHPEYVNQFPQQVGDRRLNSVEIISFLQASYHFTGKDIYKQKGLELLEDHGYLDNIMIPVTKIGRVPGIDLTTEWNHSDDELAFLSYWNLYRYAFTEELRVQFRETIRDHWEIERPEKNPLWNFIYASTGAKSFDLEEAMWSLREFPLDTISWTVRNSHRKDLVYLDSNFRGQTTQTVLPPDERPMGKHNQNAFHLDGGDAGRREFSGDIYLLPYWMGRYLGIIR